MSHLSIVVPTRNEGAVIGQLLDALQPLRAAGHELILVDGGSEDDTRAQARGRVDRLLRSPPGRARQMNLGASEATGDWLWFLHADTGFVDDPFSCVAGILGSPSVWGRFDVRLDAAAPIYRLIETGMNLRSRWSGIATGDQGIFVWRDRFLALGGYREVPLMEDLELSRRLLRLSRPRCLRPPLLTSARRWQRHGVLRTVLLMWRLRLAWFLGADPARLARRYRACSSPTRAS